MSEIMPGFLHGYRLIENPDMLDTKQVKTHQKKRINKKWRKKYGIISTPKKDVYFMGRMMIGHPETLRLIVQEVRK